MSKEEAAKILGVGSDADESQINKAYKSLIFKHHPDRGGSKEKATEINAAREILLNPSSHMGLDGRTANPDNEVWRDIEDIVGRHQEVGDDWIDDIAKRREWMDYMSGDLPYEKLTHSDHIENAKAVEEKRAKYREQRERAKAQRKSKTKV